MAPLEPVDAVFWYAPEVFEEAAGLGYDVATRWPSYFAWRLAPLGAVGLRLATSACYSFSPDMVAEHVPAAWAVVSPQQVLAARERAVDRMYKVLFGEQIGSPGLAEAAELAREAALAAETAGRALAAANADLPWPGEPHLVLWHAINLLREHRGDGHITALLAAGLDPCEALVSFAAHRAAPQEVFASRGWTAAEWSAARDRLAARGWVDAEGNATERGRDGRDEIEWRTDRLADAHGFHWAPLAPSVHPGHSERAPASPAAALTGRSPLPRRAAAQAPDRACVTPGSCQCLPGPYRPTAPRCAGG